MPFFKPEIFPCLSFPDTPSSPCNSPPMPCIPHPLYPFPSLAQLLLCSSSPATFPSWFIHPSLPMPVSSHIPLSPIPQSLVSVSTFLSYFPKPQPPQALPQYSFLPHTPSTPISPHPRTLCLSFTGTCSLQHTFSLSTPPYPTFPCTPIFPSPRASVSKILQLPTAPVFPHTLKVAPSIAFIEFF